jgi:hypothetical protein
MTNDELLTKNMELAGVIRSLRANAREDAERIERLKRERDEAREFLASEKITRDHVIKRGIEMQKERDEARQALMKIEDLFIDGTDIYADRENMGIIARNALEETK